MAARQPRSSATRASSARLARGRRESFEARRTRAARLWRELRRLYPRATCALQHGSAYELLAATILSAQCTDARVNLVTPALFARYPSITDLADADPATLEELIRSTGFYRNKARNLIGMARRVRDDFGGVIPDTMEALLTLPGVARKTANCLLGTWFGISAGIVVDTHVGRLARRLALAPGARDDKDAVRIEQELMPLTPRQDWTWLSHALIEHGRQVCMARRADCGRCGLAADCPSALPDAG